ncbi:hypothetical protein ACFFX0_18045 [Citricoccus parietis]|uniref:Uncharacterized protein n=1 Tax=Citricoccus parietis TaxID=592307 RepID=A0ABV5G247_9MICC
MQPDDPQDRVHPAVGGGGRSGPGLGQGCGAHRDSFGVSAAVSPTVSVGREPIAATRSWSPTGPISRCCSAAAAARPASGCPARVTEDSPPIRRECRMLLPSVSCPTAAAGPEREKAALRAESASASIRIRPSSITRTFSSRSAASSMRWVDMMMVRGCSR